MPRRRNKNLGMCQRLYFTGREAVPVQDGADVIQALKDNIKELSNEHEDITQTMHDLNIVQKDICELKEAKQALITANRLLKKAKSQLENDEASALQNFSLKKRDETADSDSPDADPDKTEKEKTDLQSSLLAPYRVRI